MSNGSTRDQYTISKNLVYSSQFKRAMAIVPDSRLVQIARYQPIDFKGSYMRELQPPSDVFYAYKRGEIDEKLFVELYYQRVLQRLDPKSVYEQLKGKVICCWEDQDRFCHRHIVMSWLDILIGLGYTGGEL